MNGFTRGADGTSFYMDMSTGNTVQAVTTQFPLDATLNITFEIVECVWCYFRFPRYETGKNTSYSSYVVTEPCKVHIELTSNTSKVFINNNPTPVYNANETNTDYCTLQFRTSAGNISNFKYKNLLIYKNQ